MFGGVAIATRRSQCAEVYHEEPALVIVESRDTLDPAHVAGGRKRV